jgi:hypothetical protein
VSLSAKKLADFLASAEAEELLQKQRLKDAALKQTLGNNGAEASVKGVKTPPPNPMTIQEGQSDSANPTAGELAPVVTEIYQDF